MAMFAGVTAAHADATLWEGGYVGLAIGKLDGTISGGANTFDIEGTTYGLAAGYNAAVSGEVVVGGEVTLGAGDLDIVTIGARDSADVAARLRAGYAVDSILVYASVGYGRVAVSGGTDVQTGKGLVYGLGAEYMVAPSFSVRADYSKAAYRDFEPITDLEIDMSAITIGGAFHF